MASKKKATRNVKVTLSDVKAKLEAGGYPSIGGARKAAAYLSPTDKEAALKLIAKKFGEEAEKPAKRNVKAAPAPAFVPTGKGLPRKKPLKTKGKAAEAAPVEAPAQPAKRRGRPPKAKPEQAAAVRDPDMVNAAPLPTRTRAKKEEPEHAQIAAIANVMGPLESALRILEKANSLAGGKLNTSGYQDIADTATAAVRAMQPHVKGMVHQDPPPPPPVTPSNGHTIERPFDPALLAAAAESAGLPLPLE